MSANRSRDHHESLDDGLSAAQKMERFREHVKVESSGLSEFYEDLSFTPDQFQRDALQSLALGSSVLVAAPTGAGKTVVGEGAVYLALRSGERAFYTTPIKALSNQKYREFCERFGPENVGLLTGDTSINPHADVVVMTTEVLRNMIYAGSDLDDLQVVVLDEIHYLADRVRGPVWEEVLIQLPEGIQIVALSATVSNADEFGRWIAEVRGNCDVIVSFDRPVPLYQHMIVGRRIYDLYAHGQLVTTTKDGAEHLTPALLNPDLLQAVKDQQRPQASRSRYGSESTKPGGRRIPKRVPRQHILQILDHNALLPAIVFIFSRAACDDAVSSTITSGVWLTNSEEQRLIREEVELALLSIPLADHGILGLAEWQIGLERGVAAHHAGMLPILKEMVERLFSRGLVKVVYATETLALGINMPAHTVVLESLEKWNGSEHVRLSPGEYTQLTGRAGRRGIDVEGHAVVLERGVVAPEEVAQLSSKRTYPLKSAFYPTYNMAVNLLRHATIPAARQVLESSFAQFQADDSVVELAGKLRRAEAKLAQMDGQISCSQGDARQYFALREDLSRGQKRLSQVSREGNQDSITSALRTLRVGQAVTYRQGRRWRTAAVIVKPDRSWATPLIKVVGEDGKVFSLGAHDINRGPEVVGQVRIPAGGARRPRDRQAVAKQLRALGKIKPPSDKKPINPTMAKLQKQIEELERAVREHPVHSCPDREAHSGMGHEWVRTKRECDKISRQINSATSSIAHEFDQVCQVLNGLEFLRGGKVTERGEQLRRLFGERDLLVAEVVCSDIFVDLRPEEMAALTAALVYEPRSEANGRQALDLPTPGLQRGWRETLGAYDDIHREEAKARLERIAAPSPELIGITYRWAQGVPLSAVLEESELSGGDFVRWMRQVIDLLEQMRRLSSQDITQKAEAAIKLVRRGVVAWTEK